MEEIKILSDETREKLESISFQAGQIIEVVEKITESDGYKSLISMQERLAEISNNIQESLKRILN